MILNRQDDSKAVFRGRMAALLAGPAWPGREFVLSGVTHAEIYQMAAGLRAAFDQQDVGASGVCLCTENKAIMAAAVLAAVCGGPPLVLPYSQAPNVLEELQKSMALTTVIADPEKELPGGIKALSFEKTGPQTAAGLPAHRFSPGAELLRLYTGGSTGKPKIWSKTVQNMFAEAFFQAEKMEIKKEDRFVATVPANHIYGLLFSVLVPLVSGAGVAGEIPVFPQELLSVLGHYDATVLVSIPMHYRVLGSGPIPRGGLRLALSSAGVLEPNDGLYFYRQTGVGVTEIYGSTETGGIATRCAALGQTAFTPFEVVDWRIVEDCLLVRSDFLPPDLEKDPQGFFRTSDRVSRHGENSFDLLGRSDGVVKVAGRRVDLAQIEERLKKMAGVADALVLALPVEMGRENEIAALVEGALDPVQIRQNLAMVLEPYALPRIIRVVSKIPRTPAGKFNRLEVEGILKNHGG